jgi:hypothetical protein
MALERSAAMFSCTAFYQPSATNGYGFVANAQAKLSPSINPQFRRTGGRKRLLRTTTVKWVTPDAGRGPRSGTARDTRRWLQEIVRHQTPHLWKQVAIVRWTPANSIVN